MVDAFADRNRHLREGMEIDGFRLLEVLHQSGMATLWRVAKVDGDSPVPLVMKVPRIEGSDDPATIVGFEVEQMVLPLLTGPHVPAFVAKGDFDPLPYIVMERIEGASLRAMLDLAPLPVEQVAEIGLQVALALHDLHRQGVVHLDVKPSNIMFRPSGEAVMVDFGLCHHQRLPDLLEEEFSLPMGTGPYISPEQVQYVRSDPRSDLFSLGVMLYHLSTGVRPFGQPHSIAGLRQRLYVAPRPPRDLQPHLPLWLQEVILRCLEPNPSHRYQHAQDLVTDLRQPEQLALTERSRRTGQQGTFSTLKRWLQTRAPEHKSGDSAAGTDGEAPIIMVAIGVKISPPALDEKLLETVQRILTLQPHARLACVCVMKPNQLDSDPYALEGGNARHVQHLVSIKQWAQPLQQRMNLGEHNLTFHVLESSDTASAILEFAVKNHVQHIVMGARGHSAMRRYFGSVSAQVVAEAACSVTVVRL